MALFVAVTTNSVSSWALLPVMVLASTPKTGTVILGGLFHESIELCSFDNNIPAGCKTTIEGCFDFVKGSSCFVYA